MDTPVRTRCPPPLELPAVPFTVTVLLMQVMAPGGKRRAQNSEAGVAAATHSHLPAAGAGGQPLPPPGLNVLTWVLSGRLAR